MGIGGRLMLSLFVAGAFASSSLAQQMERGSFLRKPALSRWQLLEQVKRDPIVAARYARHFGMNDRELLEYFGVLHTAKLSKGGKFRVWHVDPDGKIGSKTLMIKTGTGVFVDPDGKLVLKLSCGNPMTPGTVARKRLKEFEPRENRIPPTTLEAPKEPELDLAPPEPPSEVVDTPVEPPPIEPSAEFVPSQPSFEPSAPQVFAPPSGGGIGWWPIVPIVGAIIPKGGGTQAVPEPATVLALATGAGWVFSRRRKSRAN